MGRNTVKVHPRLALACEGGGEGVNNVRNSPPGCSCMQGRWKLRERHRNNRNPGVNATRGWGRQKDLADAPQSSSADGKLSKGEYDRRRAKLYLMLNAIRIIFRNRQQSLRQKHPEFLHEGVF